MIDSMDELLMSFNMVTKRRTGHLGDVTNAIVLAFPRK